MLYASDLITQYIPWYYITSTYLKSFHLPHWVPGIYGEGYPLLAVGEIGALSPINSLILFFSPFPASVHLLYLTYFIIATSGTYLFLRHNTLNKYSSLLGAGIFILSGFMISRYFQSSIIFSSALFPWGMQIVQKATENHKRIFWLAPLVYLQITAGHFQIAIVSICGYLAFLFVLVLLKKDKYKKYSILPIATAVVFLGIGLSAIQLLPTFKLFELSERKDWDPMVRFSYSLPQSHLITYVNPAAFGVSKPGDDYGFTQFGGGFWEINLTIYTAPFLLSLIPLITFVKRKKNINIASLYILWATFLLISFGGFFKPYWVVAHINSFPFRAPARFLLISTFAASALAAYGFQQITQKQAKYLKYCLFVIIAISIVVQQRLLLKNYFIFKNSASIMSDLKDVNNYRLTTPLPLENNQGPKQTQYFYEKLFKREFEKGAVISLISLFILCYWWQTAKKKIIKN